MNKSNKARKHSSLLLEDLLNEVTPLEMEQTKNKMLVSNRIENLIREKGWNKSQFAAKIGKNPSEVTKWLSGTQNFTIDILTEIALELGVDIQSLIGVKQDQLIYRKTMVVKSTSEPSAINLKTPYPKGQGLQRDSIFSIRGVKPAKSDY